MAQDAIRGFNTKTVSIAPIDGLWLPIEADGYKDVPFLPPFAMFVWNQGGNDDQIRYGATGEG